MVFLTHVASGKINIGKGMFLSTEMSQKLSCEIDNGNVQIDLPLVPVHLPWDGLLKLDYGEHDHLRITEKLWLRAGLPVQYSGENLSGKTIVVFPMHGLGDQLYLAATLRHLVQLFSDLKVVVVKPSIAFSEQWYHYIYHDSFFTITGPVVTCEEMETYDYYVDAEHFAHIREYEGMYPPEFYCLHLFNKPVDLTAEMKPVIGPLNLDNVTNKKAIDKLFLLQKNEGRPVVFVSTITTGRVRDIPERAVLEFVELIQQKYYVIVSTYNNEDLEREVQALNFPNVQSTTGLINNIDELINLLTEIDYVITSDSGITHLAEALGKPCGSVFNVVSPEERTKPYKFSEQLMVEFEIPEVCKTPCYIHALKDTQNCPGMIWKNESENNNFYRRYAPCMENFEGSYLVMLLDELIAKSNNNLNSENSKEVDEIIEKSIFRKDVYDIIPERASRILDFGCNMGELLLKLKRDKKCSELYGIEVNKSASDVLGRHLDGHWIIDLGAEEAELGTKYTAYFNYIILHDVVEHLYDPWYVVEKLRKYLAPDGKIIIVVPNMQFWGLIEQVLDGKFPYGAGGLMNEDHIRWFTCSSIIELALMTGYEIDYFLPLFPPGTDLSEYNIDKVKNKLRFPPPENNSSENNGLTINFSKDLRKNYFLFLANKILLVCTNSEKPVNPERVSVGGLQQRKEALNIDFKCELS